MVGGSHGPFPGAQVSLPSTMSLGAAGSCNTENTLGKKSRAGELDCPQALSVPFLPALHPGRLTGVGHIIWAPMPLAPRRTWTMGSPLEDGEQILSLWSYQAPGSPQGSPLSRPGSSGSHFAPLWLQLSGYQYRILYQPCDFLVPCPLLCK